MNYRLARLFARIAGHITLALGIIYFLFFSIAYPWSFDWNWVILLMGQMFAWLSLVVFGLAYALCAALHAYLNTHCVDEPAAPQAQRPPQPQRPVDARAEVRAQMQRQRREARAVRPSDQQPPFDP